jgi:hypothetical protein
MAHVPSSLERLAALRSEVKELERAALSELQEKRNSIAQELVEVNAQIAELTGDNPGSNRRSRRSASDSAPARNLTLQELTTLLSSAPANTLSIRKENLGLRTIKELAMANPHLLKLGSKGPWPTVTLLT